MKRQAAGDGKTGKRINAAVFRRRLMAWYGESARALPWRGTSDPYAIWVSEIMLQQTRVAAVVGYYVEFLRRFPTLVSLALATEEDVLAAWSGLGYYNRARMLHKAAQFIVGERKGQLPATAVELRTLPGIGDYTAAAIASIAFGESIAVVDGNVERVILRLTGQAGEATAAARVAVRQQAQRLMPTAVGSATAAANAAGDHNQAMMELGATVCLPRKPLCGECPVKMQCATKGEHVTSPRAAQRSLPVAFLLDLRKRGAITEVLLERRVSDAMVMPSMFELPLIPMEEVEGLEPALRIRHSITNTNYYVQVFSPRRLARPGGGRRVAGTADALRAAVPADSGDLRWVRASRLTGMPLTGLARKILQRLQVMEKPRVALSE